MRGKHRRHRNGRERDGGPNCRAQHRSSPRSSNRAISVHHSAEGCPVQAQLGRPCRTFSSHPHCERHHRRPSPTNATMSPPRGNEQVRPSPETDAETTRSVRSTLFEKAQTGPDWEDDPAGSPKTRPKSLVLKDFTRKPFEPKDLAGISS